MPLPRSQLALHEDATETICDSVIEMIADKDDAEFIASFMSNLDTEMKALTRAVHELLESASTEQHERELRKRWKESNLRQQRLHLAYKRYLKSLNLPCSYSVSTSRNVSAVSTPALFERALNNSRAIFPGEQHQSTSTDGQNAQLQPDVNNSSNPLQFQETPPSDEELPSLIHHLTQSSRPSPHILGHSQNSPPSDPSARDMRSSAFQPQHANRSQQLGPPTNTSQPDASQLVSTLNLNENNINVTNHTPVQSDSHRPLPDSLNHHNNAHQQHSSLPMGTHLRENTRPNSTDIAYNGTSSVLPPPQPLHGTHVHEQVPENIVIASGTHLRQSTTPTQAPFRTEPYQGSYFESVMDGAQLQTNLTFSNMTSGTQLRYRHPPSSGSSDPQLHLIQPPPTMNHQPPGFRLHNHHLPHESIRTHLQLHQPTQTASGAQLCNSQITPNQNGSVPTLTSGTLLHNSSQQTAGQIGTHLHSPQHRQSVSGAQLHHKHFTPGQSGSSFQPPTNPPPVPSENPFTSQQLQSTQTVGTDRYTTTLSEPPTHSALFGTQIYIQQPAFSAFTGNLNDATQPPTSGNMSLVTATQQNMPTLNSPFLHPGIFPNATQTDALMSHSGYNLASLANYIKQPQPPVTDHHLQPLNLSSTHPVSSLHPRALHRGDESNSLNPAPQQSVPVLTGQYIQPSSFVQPIDMTRQHQQDHNSHQQPQMSKTFRKSVPSIKPFVFSGNPESWLDWIGLYKATVHNTDMTDAEKLTHLQRLVSGDAKSIISGYGCNGLFYAAALDRLEDEFGNATKIVTSFLRRLDQFTGPNLRHNRSYKDLSHFLQTMVDTFTTLGFKHDLLSTTNLQTVLQKLPPQCHLEWNRYIIEKGKKQPSLIDFVRWFKAYAEACSNLDSFATTSYTNPTKDSKPSHTQKESQRFNRQETSNANACKEERQKLIFVPISRAAGILDDVNISPICQLTNDSNTPEN